MHTTSNRALSICLLLKLPGLLGAKPTQMQWCLKRPQKPACPAAPGRPGATRRRRACHAAVVPGEVSDNAARPRATQPARLPNITTTTPGARPLRATSRTWDRSPASSSLHAATPASVDKRPSETQLHYFHILKETVDDGALGNENDKIGTPFDPEDRGHQWHGVPQLDEIDKDYLSKKKVFDLPSKKSLTALIASYFALVDPYSPIIDKADFLNHFHEGTCSLFLMYAMIAVSSLYVPHEVLVECGFGDRSTAQSTFALRATLLYDFQLKDDPLHFLQGSLLMTRVLSENPTEKDSNFWYYNALRLATKIELYSHLNGSQNGSILSTMAQDPGANLAELMRPLDSWRSSLAAELQLCDQPLNTNLYYLDLIGSSYRYEATLCRLIQRQLRSVDAPKSHAAKHRLRSAMVELDAVTGKILANDMIRKIPISLMTAMPALLALHLEAALDPSESELVHSMSRISISQTMLALKQLREIPAIKKATPLFELLLSRKGLYPSSIAAAEPQMPNCETGSTQDNTLPENFAGEGQQFAPIESFDSLVQEFLEYDALGRWDFGQLGLSRNM
ncbi:hypothetical protein NLG97_g8774 [Lecanicillium saksenae]|uniref:Uncharacterized protein n=1 Tax=Lecanicillium saksenae TaxID=468837 RepID=A0ACC1QJC1_9HYPO|nr:hypothetical protein NLG97_g8774 [Lecanicillium saksenae]